MDEGEAGLSAERAAEGGVALEGVGEGGSLEEVAAAVAAATGSAAAASAAGVGAEGAWSGDLFSRSGQVLPGRVGLQFKTTLYRGLPIVEYYSTISCRIYPSYIYIYMFLFCMHI